MRCIICGGEVILNPNGNDRCVRCNLSWNTTELKDNQDWAIRHIRLLEERITAQDALIEALYQKLKELTI